MKDLLFIVSDISVVFVSTLAVFCLYHYKNPKTETLKYLFLYIFLLTLIEIAAKVVVFYFKENNLPLLHLLTLGELILLSLFYRKIIAKPNFKSKGFLYFIAFISILIICNSIFLQSIFIYNSYAKSLVQGIIIAYAILYFYNLTVHIEPQSYYKNNILDIDLNSQNQKSLRLINSSILLYYSGSLFIFMFGNHYKQNQDIYLMFWVFNAALALLFYILLFFSIWQMVYQARKYST